MYIPQQFRVTDRETIFEFIGSHTFGQLISQVDGRPYATHLPFHADPQGTAICSHLAGQNPQHRCIDGQQVLICLPGPHDYVSPDWYHSAGVPTWNYQAVHIYGVARVFRDTERLRALVESLTARYEADRETPWQPEFPEGMLGAIVGVEVSIAEVQCKFKLSQNRPAEDRVSVAQQLQALGAAELARAMRDALPASGGD